MIEIEVDFFDEIARAIYETFPEAYVVAEYVNAPPQFPAVSIIQTVNIEDASRIDSSGKEIANALTYDVNVYSNSERNRKNEAKELMQIVDEVMRKNNYRRTVMMPLDNAADPSIYRMTARYVGLIDNDLVQYRR